MCLFKCLCVGVACLISSACDQRISRGIELDFSTANSPKVWVQGLSGETYGVEHVKHPPGEKWTVLRNGNKTFFLELLQDGDHWMFTVDTTSPVLIEVQGAAIETSDNRLHHSMNIRKKTRLKIVAPVSTPPENP